MGLGGGPADEGRGVLQGRVAAHTRADEELADLAPEPRRIGDNGAEIDVVGEPVERTAERDQRARVVGNGGVLQIVDDGPGMGKLAPDLEEGGELDGAASPTVPRSSARSEAVLRPLRCCRMFEMKLQVRGQAKAASRDWGSN